jgi:hypothetical protein
MNLSDSEDAYNQVYADEPHHKKSWTHEFVAAAAGFAGKLRLPNENSWRKKSKGLIKLTSVFRYTFPTTMEPSHTKLKMLCFRLCPVVLHRPDFR